MAAYELAGKAALITGAARGLGLVLSEDLARMGVNLVGCDFRKDDLEARYSELSSKYGVKAIAVGADVGVEEDVVRLAKRAKEGLGKIDFLINNAGIRATAKVWETDTKTWDQIHDTNLRGQFLVVREVLNTLMLEANTGVIVNVSSGSGKMGQEDCSSYCASKWGILGFTESIAKDLKKTRIRACSVTPGVIWTPMAQEQAPPGVDLSYFDPKHVSRAIIFLLQQDEDTVIPELRIYHRKQL